MSRVWFLIWLLSLIIFILIDGLVYRDVEQSIPDIKNATYTIEKDRKYLEDTLEHLNKIIERIENALNKQKGKDDGQAEDR